MDREKTREGAAGLVLVHGSELGAWLWERLEAELDVPALAIDLPGRGGHAAPRRSVRLTDAVTSVIDDTIAAGMDDVVLVAHSFSGILAPAVVAGLGDRVRAVVLVGATVPMLGSSFVDLLPLTQRLLLRAMYRVRPDGLLSPAGENVKTLGNDLDEETTAWFLSRRVPEAPRLLLDPAPVASYPDDVPVHYVRLLQDRSISEPAREAMLTRLPDAQIHDLDAGHLPMLGQPELLARLLEKVAA